MDASRFDRAARALASGTARRTLLLGVVSGLLTALPAPLRPEAVLAKHKHKHHKPKQCKGRTKKCRHACIAVTACCTSDDCQLGATCVRGTCHCPSGFRNCRGTCIPSGNCCDTTDCPDAQVCVNSICSCPKTSDIICGDACCDGAADEVCAAPDNACQAGGCPATDVCNSLDTFFCAHTTNGADRPCLCASIIDATETTACVDFISVIEPTSCTMCDLAHACAAGKVCIPGNTAGSQFCGCNNAFCVPRCANAPGSKRSS